MKNFTTEQKEKIKSKLEDEIKVLGEEGLYWWNKTFGKFEEAKEGDAEGDMRGKGVYFWQVRKGFPWECRDNGTDNFYEGTLDEFLEERFQELLEFQDETNWEYYLDG